MAGRTCREAVERVASTRAELTEEERERLECKGLGALTAGRRRRLQSREITSLAVAVMEADVEALEWLIQLFDKKRLDWLVFGGRLACLAAGRGKIESLTNLRANGCPWHDRTCTLAARGGHLEVLKWARRNGCPWDAKTCEEAAAGGHLEVLQWARQNGCEWEESTCARAARGGTWRYCSGRVRTGARGT